MCSVMLQSPGKWLIIFCIVTLMLFSAVPLCRNVMWCNTKTSSSLNYNQKFWQFPHSDLTLFMYHMNPKTQHDDEIESEPSNTRGKKKQMSSSSFTYAKDLIYLNYSFGWLCNLLLQPQKRLKLQNFFSNPFPSLHVIM